MAWKIKNLKKNLKFRKPILIEGLPGIGNVGKLTVDFLIDELKAKGIMEISSYDMPNLAFVNEGGLIEIPKIKIFYKKMPKNDILFLAGDTQPTENRASYEFCDSIVSLSKKLDVKEIITLGGIGLLKDVKKPKIYCTSHSKKILANYKKNFNLKTDLYGVVGPIFGASGLLVGLAQNQNIDATALLAETSNHPLNLGVKGTKELIKLLDKRLDLNINLKKLDSEVKKIEKQINENFDEVLFSSKDKVDTNYIG